MKLFIGRGTSIVLKADSFFPERDTRRKNLGMSMKAYRKWFYARDRLKGFLKAVCDPQNKGKDLSHSSSYVNPYSNERGGASVSVPEGKFILVLEGTDVIDIPDALSKSDIERKDIFAFASPEVSLLMALDRDRRGGQSVTERVPLRIAEAFYQLPIGLNNIQRADMILWNQEYQEQFMKGGVPEEILRILQEIPLSPNGNNPPPLGVELVQRMVAWILAEGKTANMG